MNPLHVELGLGVFGLILLLLESFLTTSKRTIAYLGIGGLGLALIALISGSCCGFQVPADLASYYAADSLAIFYKGLALISTICVLILSLEYAPVFSHYSASKPEKGNEAGQGEFFTLPIFICVGLMFMASAIDLATIFVSLELVTVSFYVMVAMMRRSLSSLEAGVKYLILGALSTGLFIYGIAWIYGVTGELTLAGIGQKIANWEGDSTALLFASVLILASLGFKVAAVPFHSWVPDVYQGAPTPVTAFLSVGSKAAGFVVLSRFVEILVVETSPIASTVSNLLLVSGGATLLVGNFAAIGQTNFKRLLGYSSIAHAGFLLVALGCVHGISGFSSTQITAFYLATYLPMTFIAFLFLSLVRAQGVGEDLVSLGGLGRNNTWLGLCVTIALASLAGLPLTAGFMGKWMVIFSAAYDGSYWALAFAILGAATGFYYYFKVILAIYQDSSDAERIKIKISPLSQALLAVLTLSILVIGVYPKSVRQLLDSKPKAAVSMTR